MSELRQYSEYKDSGVKWLGAVPADWQLRPLWTLFERGKRLGTGTEELLSVYRDYGVIPKSSRDDNFNRASDDLSKYQLVEPADLVINKMKAWQGSVAVSEHRGIVSPAYFVFTPKETMNLRFMHYLMRSQSYFQHYASISKGVRPNQWDLDPDQHRLLPVLFPPLEDQRAIATFLDRETSQIDAFITDQEELIGLLNERRMATISRAVIKGLDPDVQMKDSGVEWLGRVPQDWEVMPLRHLLATKLKYGANEPADNDDPRWVRYLRITDFALDGTLKEDTFRSLPHDVASGYMVSPGDILLARSGATVGKAFLVPEDTPASCFAGYLIRVDVAREKLQPKFFFLYTQTASFAGWKDSTLIMATIPNIGADRYATLPVPVPPIEDQHRITNYLDRETSEIDAAIADARESIELSKERRAALISAAVTGKIDVRHRALTGTVV